MSRLIYVPIEPLEERYTGEWYRQFPKVFKKYFNEVIIIDGEPLTNSIETGAFLDINSTIAYKNSQMRKIAEMFYKRQIKDGDVFFFGDIEFWGIESLRLMAQINNIDIKIGAFLHAASHAPGDAFQVAADYQKYTELGWYKAVDYVFIGSQYHLDILRKERLSLLGVEALEIMNKFIVTGNPLFKEEYENYKIPKKNKIVFASRWDIEKRPERFLAIANILKQKYPAWSFEILTGSKELRSNSKELLNMAKDFEKRGIIKINKGLTKKEYHKHLAEAKVLFCDPIQETFGYTIAEACIYNCNPVVCNDLSYPEILENDKDLLFDNYLVDGIKKIERIMQNPKKVNRYVEKYYNVADQIAQTLKGV